ncbi:hypothetical protein SK128_016163, partial [Halocaridina rubra]
MLFLYKIKEKEERNPDTGRGSQLFQAPLLSSDHWRVLISRLSSGHKAQNGESSE